MLRIRVEWDKETKEVIENVCKGMGADCQLIEEEYKSKWGSFKVEEESAVLTFKTNFIESIGQLMIKTYNRMLPFVEAGKAIFNMVKEDIEKIEKEFTPEIKLIKLVDFNVEQLRILGIVTIDEFGQMSVPSYYSLNGRLKPETAIPLIKKEAMINGKEFKSLEEAQIAAQMIKNSR